MYKYDFKEFAREGEQITINESVYIPSMLPEHTHNFLEIFYMTEGHGQHEINGHRQPIREGEIWVLGFGTRHTLIPDREVERFTWININFMPGFIDGSMINEYNSNEIIKLSIFRNLFFDSHNITYLRLSETADSYERLIKLMLAEYNEHKYGYISCLKHYLIVLLTKVFCDSASEKQESDSGWLLQTVLDEISENIVNTDGSKISLSRFAQRVYMSPKSFSRLFHQKMGVGFSHYVQQKRIEKSCKLLSETDMPVNAVMLEVGYGDAKTFYSLFKRITGMTPLQYRNRVHGTET